MWGMDLLVGRQGIEGEEGKLQRFVAIGHRLAGPFIDQEGQGERLDLVAIGVSDRIAGVAVDPERRRADDAQARFFGDLARQGGGDGLAEFLPLAGSPQVSKSPRRCCSERPAPSRMIARTPGVMTRS